MQPDQLETEAAARARQDRAWLSDACGLSPETIAALLPFYLPLATQIAARQRAQGAPLVVGIQGPQGAGKTTLTRLIERVLHDVGGLSVATLSIDDLYLTRAQRTELARRVHPLFQTRGVPGTHDVELGMRVLEALTRPGRVGIPRFDKGQDDRTSASAWPTHSAPCDVVLFEGLWIGVPPIAEEALAQPINALEAKEDAHARWRTYANQQLATRYPALFSRCQLLVHLQVPDFGCVKRWRSAAEHALRAHLEAGGRDTSRVMDDTALARFFAHYERFTEHAMREMPVRAEIVLRLDAAQHVLSSTLPTYALAPR